MARGQPDTSDEAGASFWQIQLSIDWISRRMNLRGLVKRAYDAQCLRSSGLVIKQGD